MNNDTTIGLDLGNKKHKVVGLDGRGQVVLKCELNNDKETLGAEFGKDLDWTYGLPGARLASALREWQVTELPGDYYQMLNASDGDIVTLFKAFGIDVPAKIYTKGDLLELKSAIDPF